MKHSNLYLGLVGWQSLIKMLNFVLPIFKKSSYQHLNQFSIFNYL
jgi:hypothetical protein